MEFLQNFHSIAALSYLVIAEIAFLAIFFVGGSWMLEPTTLAKTIKLINRITPLLLFMLGVLYFVCYSFKIY